MDQTPPAEDLPPAVVTFITTEHFALSTSRAAGLSEAGSRVSFFLVSVSSGLVALAFIGQASQLGAAFYVFGLTVLPTLAFLGITTFERILRNGMEDIRYARQINQIRQFYFDASPLARRYLRPPVPDDPVAVVSDLDVNPQHAAWYGFLSTAGGVGVVNSVVLGGTIGLLIQLLSHSLAAAAAVGALTGLAAIGAHMARQRAAWHAAAVRWRQQPAAHR